MSVLPFDQRDGFIWINGALVAWADFTTNPPINNEYDLTTPFVAATSGAVQPGGDETAGVGTGGRSGSRLFQRA